VQSTRSALNALEETMYETKNMLSSNNIKFDLDNDYYLNIIKTLKELKKDGKQGKEQEEGEMNKLIKKENQNIPYESFLMHLKNKQLNLKEEVNEIDPHFKSLISYLSLKEQCQLYQYSSFASQWLENQPLSTILKPSVKGPSQLDKLTSQLSDEKKKEEEEEEEEEEDDMIDLAINEVNELMDEIDDAFPTSTSTSTSTVNEAVSNNVIQDSHIKKNNKKEKKDNNDEKNVEMIKEEDDDDKTSFSNTNLIMKRLNLIENFADLLNSKMLFRLTDAKERMDTYEEMKSIFNEFYYFLKNKIGKKNINIYPEDGKEEEGDSEVKEARDVVKKEVFLIEAISLHIFSPIYLHFCTLLFDTFLLVISLTLSTKLSS